MNATETERAEARKARNEKIPFAWRIVKVEQKSMCDKGWVEDRKIASCGYFYLYDANRHVHICSFTPSYELFPVAEYSTFTEEVSEEVASEVDEAMRESEEPVSYMDVSDVERMPSQPVSRVPKREHNEDAETYYNRAAEEMREHFQGNPPRFTDGKS